MCGVCDERAYERLCRHLECGERREEQDSKFMVRFHFVVSFIWLFVAAM